MTRRVLLTLVVVGVAGSLAGFGTVSAFSSASTTAAGSFAAGTVAVSDTHPATAPLTIAGLRPDTTSASCLGVTYDGSLDANVRQYASPGGALVPYLNVRITRGSGLTEAFPACTGFTPDATDYAGKGAGVIYEGPADGLPATAELDPTSAQPEVWTAGETHAYRYEFWVAANSDAQGLAATLAVSFEAHDL